MHSTLFLLAAFHLAVLLAIVPLTSATPSLSQPLDFHNPAIQQRDSNTLSWTHVGCFVDDPSRPVLTGYAYSNPKMTIGLCIKTCKDSNKKFAGLENGTFCYCGDVLTVDFIETLGSECSDGPSCAGDPNETCGASLRLDLYWSGVPAQSPPTIPQVIDSWDFLGCVRDSSDDRILPHRATEVRSFNITVDYCIITCLNSGYDIAGMEFAQECWCGSGNLPDHAQVIDSNNCVLACPMDSAQICGGANALVVYKRRFW